MSLRIQPRQWQRYWQDSSLLEHASIAAFSRFVLDLMSLGAPARLVEDATTAMLDESAHARACFSLASTFAGQPRGPSRLDVTGSLDQRDLRDIVVTAVLEGCIGETVAALEAAEALEHASDPAVRWALTRIAEDELRHAALAYRFVHWAVAAHGPALAREVQATFDAVLQAQQALPDGPETASVPSHGLLSAAHRWELRARVLHELVAPSLPALLAA